MRNATLFDDQDELENVAWDCAQKILAIRPTAKILPGATDALTDNLIRWCPASDLNGEHWPPERKMRWLVQEVSDHCTAAPSFAEMRAMLLDKFSPDPNPKPLGKKPPIECRYCNDMGFREVVEKGKRSYVWCECSIGKAVKQSSPDHVAFLNRKFGGPVRSALPCKPSLRLAGNRAVGIKGRKKR